MAFIEQSHVNDIGTRFRVTVNDTDSTGGTTVANISTASTKTFIFGRPDGSTFNKTAVFVTDGSDGLLEYATVDGDLNVAGTWSLQVYVVTSAGSHYSNIGNFKVFDNLS